MGLTQADFEYKGDEGKTKKNRIYEDDGSFFTVGDVGELDDDRCLFLRDRKIDMIICGGVNNYPSEIESAFTTVPSSRSARTSAAPIIITQSGMATFAATPAVLKVDTIAAKGPTALATSFAPCAKHNSETPITNGRLNSV